MYRNRRPLETYTVRVRLSAVPRRTIPVTVGSSALKPQAYMKQRGTPNRQTQQSVSDDNRPQETNLCTINQKKKQCPLLTGNK